MPNLDLTSLLAELPPEFQRDSSKRALALGMSVPDIMKAMAAHLDPMESYAADLWGLSLDGLYEAVGRVNDTEALATLAYFSFTVEDYLYLQEMGQIELAELCRLLRTQIIPAEAIKSVMELLPDLLRSTSMQNFVSLVQIHVQHEVPLEVVDTLKATSYRLLYLLTLGVRSTCSFAESFAFLKQACETRAIEYSHLHQGDPEEQEAVDLLLSYLQLRENRSTHKEATLTVLNSGTQPL